MGEGGWKVDGREEDRWVRMGKGGGGSGTRNPVNICVAIVGKQVEMILSLPHDF